MSYDIWLEADLGGTERVSLDHDDPGNITYNVDAMFALALNDADAGVRNGADIMLRRKDPALKRFIDRPAQEAVEPLRAAVARMEADPASYKALEPENGWGDYEGALAYLRRFLDACERAPRAIVGGWL